MRLQFEQVETETQLRMLAVMADEIWHEFFPGIISQEQIDYMVKKFQSYEAIRQQLEDGYEYQLFLLNGEMVGYMGYHRDAHEKLFLSKLYLKKEYRGQRLASDAFAFLEQYCINNGLGAIWLTVNRYNEHSVCVYEKKGFLKVRTQAADIGEGFVMDDYIMEKRIYHTRGKKACSA